MSDLKGKFLDCFIKIASVKGINQTSISDASKEIYNDSNGYIIEFYNGLSDILIAIEERYDSLLFNKKSEIDNIKSITEKIKFLLTLRIKKDGLDYKFRKILMNFYKTLDGVDLFIKTSWSSSDIIWSLAGDHSLDFNYYSKRIILLYVYTDSKKYYSSIDDEDFSKTLKNIEKNLERVKIFNKLKTSLKAENIPFIRLFK
jgi:ubiquinone biosynthesis protein COQ9